MYAVGVKYCVLKTISGLAYVSSNEFKVNKLALLKLTLQYIISNYNYIIE